MSTKDSWADCSVDDHASLYDNQLDRLLDSLIPVKTVTCRRWPSDPWFDLECRQTKRQVRNLERKASAGNSTDAIADWLLYSARNKDISKVRTRSNSSANS